jgi:hypothetical protein
MQEESRITKPHNGVIRHPGKYQPLGPKGELQYMEGGLDGCLGNGCKVSCCDDKRVEEWVPEFSTFHRVFKDYLRSLGVNITFGVQIEVPGSRNNSVRQDLVQFTNCSEDGKCKFLRYAPNRDIDPRPIDCKIYPYAVDWKTIDWDRNVFKVHLWDNGCPVVESDSGIPQSFRDKVTYILKRDFKTLFGADFSFEYVNEVLQD